MLQEKDLILVVDDDQAVREALTFSLQLEGHAVQCCGSGAELFAHPCFDAARCVVLDYKMPQMNGLEVMERLSLLDRQLPVIMITGQMTEGLRRRATALGIKRIVEKPLLDSTLSDAIRCALKH